ncbi:MAG: hypothetical protein MJK04_24095, partial [Psychrosphaera sp.]|nr:hypothetical protein [Psychrosphaera sp.]
PLRSKASTRSHGGSEKERGKDLKDIKNIKAKNRNNTLRLICHFHYFIFAFAFALPLSFSVTPCLRVEIP